MPSNEPFLTCVGSADRVSRSCDSYGRLAHGRAATGKGTSLDSKSAPLPPISRTLNKLKLGQAALALVLRNRDAILRSHLFSSILSSATAVKILWILASLAQS